MNFGLRYLMFGPVAGLSYLRLEQILIGLGGVAVLVGALLFHFGMHGDEWPRVTARILSVETKCRMSTDRYVTYGVRNRSRTESITIGCDQVDQFRRDNESRQWRLSKSYRGQVRLIGPTQSVDVEMALPRTNGNIPVVGGEFTVLQDPDNPRHTRSTEANLALTVLGGCAMALGAFFLAIVFFWF